MPSHTNSLNSILTVPIDSAWGTGFVFGRGWFSRSVRWFAVPIPITNTSIEMHVSRVEKDSVRPGYRRKLDR